MDLQRQQTLWAIALENYQAAGLMAQQGWHNVSVACSYYAVFTAMWVAVGRATGTTLGTRRDRGTLCSRPMVYPTYRPSSER